MVASHILWEGPAASFRVFVFGRFQKSNKLEAAPEAGPSAKIYYFYVTSPLGWLLWRDHDALLPVLFHPSVPPFCPTPMSHFLPGICWYAILQVVYPETLPLCNPPFHPTQKRIRRTSIIRMPAILQIPNNPANPDSEFVNYRVRMGLLKTRNQKLKTVQSCFGQHPPKNLLRSPPVLLLTFEQSLC